MIFRSYYVKKMIFFVLAIQIKMHRWNWIEGEVEFALKNKISFHNLKEEAKISCTALRTNMIITTLGLL